MKKRYHVLLSRPFDLDKFDRDAAQGQCPRHATSLLRHALDAEVHQPVGHEVVVTDRLWGRAFAVSPQQSAIGRVLAQRLTDQDVIFAAGEDVGFPLAFALRGNATRPRLVVEVHNPQGARPLFALRHLGLDETVDLFVVTADFKAEFLTRELRFRSQQVHSMNQTTDTDFFTPGPPSPDKQRPLIAASGLEQRDYITLAAATKDMDVDVRICAVSPNATARRGTFPKVVPDNMRAQYYDWTDLLQLYRDADVVVIPLRPNGIGAGQTAIMEALACARPVVTTTQAGSMVDTCAADGLLDAVPPQEADALQRAILEVLEHPEQAAERASRARARMVEGFSPERWVRHMTGLLRPEVPPRSLSPWDHREELR